MLLAKQSFNGLILLVR